MTIKKLNKSKTPIVKIYKTLDKISKKVLFPEKVEETNLVLKRESKLTSKDSMVILDEFEKID